ncbi:DUF732 domain-containing protein [Actinophytocola sediminis]
MIESKSNRRWAVIGAVVTLALVVVLGLVSGEDGGSVPGAAGSALNLTAAVDPSTDQLDSTPPLGAPLGAEESFLEATSSEVDYLDRLDNRGVDVTPWESLIGRGYDTCATDMLTAIADLRALGYSHRDAGSIQAAAAATLCRAGGR